VECGRNSAAPGAAPKIRRVTDTWQPFTINSALAPITLPRANADAEASRWRASFSYLYEPLRIYDYAFDPSVVNGIVQPSSLVMGYVYRPYTANSFVFRIRYSWR
jgi:hypothetical protein